MGLWEFLTGKKKKDSKKTEQQDAVEMKDLASQIMGLKVMGNQSVIESIDSDGSSVFGDAEDDQPDFHKERQKNGTVIQKAGNQEEIDPDVFLEQMSMIEGDDLPILNKGPEKKKILSKEDEKNSEELLFDFKGGKNLDDPLFGSDEEEEDSKLLSEENDKSDPKSGFEDDKKVMDLLSQYVIPKADENKLLSEKNDKSDLKSGFEDGKTGNDLLNQFVILESGENMDLSGEVPKKGGASEEWEHIDSPTNAIEYERVPDKVRERLTEKKAGELRTLLADKSSQEGIEAIREKYKLTKEDMKKPDAVPRMTEPYFRAAISDLSKDKSLTKEQQKALSDFSEEMDQQMMINAMKAPNEEQIENLWRAFMNGEENEQMAREFKAKGMQKVLFGGEGVIENLKNRYRPPVPGLGDAGAKMVEEKKRQKESARSLLKIFLMLQIGNMQMRETDQETGRETDTDWAHNMSDLFAHGGRIMIETGDQSGDSVKKDSVGDVMASVFSRESALEKRMAATHYIAEGEMGEFKEKRKFGAAAKGAFDSSWENYGLPVAIGGSGSKGPLMLDEEVREKNQIIRADNRNGHLYVGKKEGSQSKHGGFLIGLESEGTYRMSQWGHIHTVAASAGRINSTGGMKKDLHGDKTSGRNLYLGGMKNKELIDLMKAVDTGFNELYGSNDDAKQEEYDEILRKLTGKRLEAEEVEEILKTLTKKNKLEISVEKIREESNADKPILPKDLMAEPVEEPELTPEEKKRREERDKILSQLLPSDPSKWQRFEVEKSPKKDPKGTKRSMKDFFGIGEKSPGGAVVTDPNDMVHRFLSAQGKRLEIEKEDEERYLKKEEEKKKHGDPYADVPLDAGPLFYEDDKSPEAKKEYEEANRKAEEKLKKEKGGDQVYDPEKVGQDWLYDRDENGKYYSAQVSSDPTHFGKTHKLDTSAYLILADQVIRVDDYIAGRTTLAEEKAVKETKPESEKEASKEKVSGETALVPFGIKVLNLTEAMQKNCMDGIENLRQFMMKCAPEEDKEWYRTLFASIELYEKALFTGQLAEQSMKPDDIFRFIPLESTRFRISYDLGKLMETGITTDQLQALRQSLEITDTVNPAVGNLCKAVAAAQKAIVEAKGLKELPEQGIAELGKEKEDEEKKDELDVVRSIAGYPYHKSQKLISDNPFAWETKDEKTKEDEKTEPEKKKEELKPDFDFGFDFNFNLEDLHSEVSKLGEKKEESSKNPKDEEGPIFPNPWDIRDISQELMQEPKPEEKKKEELKPEEKKEEPKPEEKKEEPKPEEKKEEPKPEEKKEEPKPVAKKEEPKPEKKKEELKTTTSTSISEFFMGQNKKNKENKTSQLNSINLNSKVPKLVQKIPAESSKEEVKLKVNRVPKKLIAGFNSGNIPLKQKKEKLLKGKDIGTDVMPEKQLTGASCYAYVAAALLRHFGKKYGVKGVESVRETSFPEAYGYRRIKTGEIYPRGENGNDFYEGYKLGLLKTKGLREEFKSAAFKVGFANAQDMPDIVEAIHQLSGGKAALNYKFYDDLYKESLDKTEDKKDKAKKKNMEQPNQMKDLKDLVMHVLNDRKMPIGLNRMKGGDGHYVLVVGADNNEYFYRDPLHPEKLQKEDWGSLKAYQSVSVSFLQHMDEISPERNKDYSLATDGNPYSELIRTQLFQEDKEAHLRHTDVYAYDDKKNKHSYYSLLPKKKK